MRPGRTIISYLVHNSDMIEFHRHDKNPMNLCLFQNILLKYTKVHRGKVNFSRSLNSWLQSQDWSSYLGDSGVQAPSAMPVTSDIDVLRWSPRQRDRCRTSGSHAPSCAQGSQFPFPGCQGLTLVRPHC